MKIALLPPTGELGGERTHSPAGLTSDLRLTGSGPTKDGDPT